MAPLAALVVEAAVVEAAVLLLTVLEICVVDPPLPELEPDPDPMLVFIDPLSI